MAAGLINFSQKNKNIDLFTVFDFYTSIEGNGAYKLFYVSVVISNFMTHFKICTALFHTFASFV